MLGLWLQDKVVVVPGDLHKPGLGLSAEDEERITNEVQFVVHSAASISFFEHIHTLLEQNYEVGAASAQSVVQTHSIDRRLGRSHSKVPPEGATLLLCHIGPLCCSKAQHTHCCLLLTLQALCGATFKAGLVANT